MLYSVESTVYVGFEYQLEVFLRQIIDFCIIPDRSAVDENIQRAKSVNCVCYQLLNVCFLSYICEAELYIISEALLSEQRHGCLFLDPGVGCDNYLGTSLKESERDIKSKSG